MKILVTGGNGQLGSELNKISIDHNFEWLFTDRQSFNISDLDNINIFLCKSNPDIIINCAAYTSVDKAEDDFETANIINHKSVELIAKWSYNNKCRLIHVSTDYVYDGNSLFPYQETDETNPLNNYGKSKLLGDLACQKQNPSSIIIRTSWLYADIGNNFLKKLIKLSKNNHEVNVINDQIGCPTYAGDLAKTIIDIIDNGEWHPGIYNYTNKGNSSWYDFANEIKSIFGLDAIIRPISSKDYFQKAKRPKYSVLDNTKIVNTFNIEQIDYLESLKKFIKTTQNES